MKVIEGSKERIQVFKGVVLRRQGGGGVRETFTVRKESYGVGVERTFRCTRPTSTTSTSSPEVTCVAPSFTTCGSCAARRRRSRKKSADLPGRAGGAIGGALATLIP